MASPEDITRRRKMMADAGARADRRIAEVERNRQERLAAIIRQAISEAGEGVPVKDAIEMLKRF